MSEEQSEYIHNENFIESTVGWKSGEFIISRDEENVGSSYAFIKMPEKSPWRCHLFGSKDCGGIVWMPNRGEEPNWFWRKMQFLFFGNRWIKNAEEKQQSSQIFF